MRITSFCMPSVFCMADHFIDIERQFFLSCMGERGHSLLEARYILLKILVIFFFVYVLFSGF